MQKSKSLLFSILIFTFFIFAASVAFASETNGTIVGGGNNGYAWSDQTGWVNFAATNGSINITDSGITGSAWSMNYGWINMSPTNGGVAIAANGALSGYAWGSGLGWINFSGVSINSSGRFVGTASGTTIGTLTFDCTNCSVTTDFRAQNFRTVIAPTPSGGGGGGIFGMYDKPNGPFSVTINGGASAANSRNIQLALSAGSNVARMAISNFADFHDVVQDNYQTTKNWTLAEGEGEKTVYVKFYTQFGQPSDTIYDSIVYSLALPEVKISEAPIEEQILSSPIPSESVSSGVGSTATIPPASAETLTPAASEEAETAAMPAQLFDINLEIENTKIAGLKDLVARVLFTSFGRVPTPVDLTFDILNESGEKVYSAEDEVTVQTQAVLTKRFADVEEILGIGKYTLLVTTLYNVDVVDEFRQDFEIAGEEAGRKPFWRSLWFWAISTILLIIIFFVVIKRTKDNEENEGDNTRITY